MVQAIQVLRFHLLELEKVSYNNKFLTTYYCIIHQIIWQNNKIVI